MINGIFWHVAIGLRPQFQQCLYWICIEATTIGAGIGVSETLRRWPPAELESVHLVTYNLPLMELSKYNIFNRQQGRLLPHWKVEVGIGQDEVVLCAGASEDKAIFFEAVDTIGALHSSPRGTGTLLIRLALLRESGFAECSDVRLVARQFQSD
ncbi:unnamed protein product [Schistocephalus solidus]|uniref:Uncharacterized protein n=1 Tax=Schistocephalus solidus TaxID=70667 RepID=A0A3P7E3E8_SCHSO|nr:unnamed protein product [Schistocephalus solidus]